MSVSRDTIETLMSRTYFREKYYFLACMFKKTMKNVKVKVDVQKEGGDPRILGFKDLFIENRWVSFIHITSSSIVVIW